jgi:hypothetical protein
MMAEIREAGPRDKADIARADHHNTHGNFPQTPIKALPDGKAMMVLQR